eukprot:m.90561 g.90561  ORF g.90561 m.90561 type:complete len:690 (+) comp12916_c0_seq11:564-2633(+)
MFRCSLDIGGLQREYLALISKKGNVQCGFLPNTSGELAVCMELYRALESHPVAFGPAFANGLGTYVSVLGKPARLQRKAYHKLCDKLRVACSSAEPLCESTEMEVLSAVQMYLAHYLSESNVVVVGDSRMFYAYKEYGTTSPPSSSVLSAASKPCVREGVAIEMGLLGTKLDIVITGARLRVPSLPLENLVPSTTNRKLFEASDASKSIDHEPCYMLPFLEQGCIEQVIPASMYPDTVLEEAHSQWPWPKAMLEQSEFAAVVKLIGSKSAIMVPSRCLLAEVPHPLIGPKDRFGPQIAPRFVEEIVEAIETLGVECHLEQIIQKRGTPESSVSALATYIKSDSSQKQSRQDRGHALHRKNSVVRKAMAKSPKASKPTNAPNDKKKRRTTTQPRPAPEIAPTSTPKQVARTGRKSGRRALSKLVPSPCGSSTASQAEPNESEASQQMDIEEEVRKETQNEVEQEAAEAEEEAEVEEAEKGVSAAKHEVEQMRLPKRRGKRCISAPKEVSVHRRKRKETAKKTYGIEPRKPAQKKSKGHVAMRTLIDVQGVLEEQDGQGHAEQVEECFEDAIFAKDVEASPISSQHSASSPSPPQHIPSSPPKKPRAKSTRSKQTRGNAAGMNLGVSLANKVGSSKRNVPSRICMLRTGRKQAQKHEHERFKGFAQIKRLEGMFDSMNLDVLVWCIKVALP